MNKTRQGSRGTTATTQELTASRYTTQVTAPPRAVQQLQARDLAMRLRASHVTKTLWPGQAGTLKLLQQQGACLVCVRYRHDPNGLRRYTTIELVVDSAIVKSSKARRQIFDVAIGFEEESLRKLAKKHGAKWSPERKMWALPGQAVQALGLTHRAKSRPPK